VPTGDVFFQGVTSAWNRPSAFVESLPSRGQDQNTNDNYLAGFKVGGPFVQDRAFYFAAFERRRANDITTFTGITRDGIKGGWTVAPSNDDNLFVRTDYNLGPKNFLMVRLSGDRRTSDALNVAGNLTPETGFQLREETGSSRRP